MKKGVFAVVFVLALLFAASFASAFWPFAKQSSSLNAQVINSIPNNVHFSNSANCIDSDGGTFSEIAGNVSVRNVKFWRLGNQKYNVYSDYCTNSSTLLENYCYKGTRKFAKIKCEGGCEKGACISQTRNFKLAVLITKPNGASDPQLNEKEFGFLKQYIKEISYGKINLEDIDIYGGYVTDSYEIDKDKSFFIKNSDINYSDYSHILFVDERRSLFTTKANAQKINLSTKEGIVSVWSMYFNPEGVGITLLAHEFGHTLGLEHANAMFCNSNYYEFGVCNSAWYGDSYDSMGAGNFGYYSSIAKERLGVLNENNILVAFQDRVYTLKPIEQAEGLVLLKIPHKRNESGDILDYYYVEFRIPQGFDSQLEKLPAIQIRVYFSANTTFILTSIEKGEEFIDESTGFKLKVLNISMEQAIINVSLANKVCIRYEPSFSILNVGEEFKYELKNNDAGTCSPRQILFQSESDLLFERSREKEYAPCDIGQCILSRYEPIYFFPNEILKGRIVTTEGGFSVDIIDSERGIIANWTIT